VAGPNRAALYTERSGCGWCHVEWDALGGDGVARDRGVADHGAARIGQSESSNTKRPGKLGRSSAAPVHDGASYSEASLPGMK